MTRHLVRTSILMREGVFAVVAPVMAALVPKCPLCVAGLLGAIGIAVPSSSVLDTLVLVIAGCWLLWSFLGCNRLASWIGMGAIALLLLGRFMSSEGLSWAGAVMLIPAGVMRAGRSGLTSCKPGDCHG
jgi:hypothetical protein